MKILSSPPLPPSLSHPPSLSLSPALSLPLPLSPSLPLSPALPLFIMHYNRSSLDPHPFPHPKNICWVLRERALKRGVIQS